MTDQRKHYLRCKVYPGQFSGEFAVSGEQCSGERYSLFVPIRFVKTDREPTRDSTVEGWILVDLWDLSGNSAVVKLPRESFESGRFITVGIDQFQTRPEPAEVNP